MPLSPFVSDVYHKLDWNMILTKIHKVIYDLSKPFWFGSVPTDNFGDMLVRWSKQMSGGHWPQFTFLLYWSAYGEQAPPILQPTKLSKAPWTSFLQYTLLISKQQVLNVQKLTSLGSLSMSGSWRNVFPNLTFNQTITHLFTPMTISFSLLLSAFGGHSLLSNLLASSNGFPATIK